ncbi:MAG: carboxypeptidase-like regulatory domain-containing protein [Flavobacteriaceae bacterium]|nr:carboxypeptidase-like regulatory domain-containing protein [Flavobacteriaceae bacterium]
MTQKKSAINARLNLRKKKQTPITFVLFAFLFGPLISVYGNSNNFSLENASSSINQIILKGMITDDMGSPLPGATIVEKGSANGTTSDFEGSFSITVSDSDSMIQLNINLNKK